MKQSTKFILPLIFFGLLQSSAFAEDFVPELISQAEADATIADRMAAKARKEAEIRQKLNSASIVVENSFKTGGGDVIVRRVVARTPTIMDDAPTAFRTASDENSIQSDFEFPVDPRKHESISVSAVIFDDHFSKVVWRDTETGRTLDIWTNINMFYLNPLSSFDTESAHYTYFAMAQTITREGEEKRKEMTAKMGYDYESRWEHPPVKLSDETLEYVVVTETSEAVPEKLHEQMDALFAFYLEKRESLEVDYLNAQKLRIAHEKFLKENPPEKKPSITNFWPGTNSSYQGEQR